MILNIIGFTSSSDQKDDKDLLRQLRLLYTKSNRLLRLFYHCSTDVKIALFRSYCTCFYCPFLLTHYKKSTHSKLRVAFIMYIVTTIFIVFNALTTFSTIVLVAYLVACP